MLPFTLRQLEIFREIARRGAVTAAADAAGITQSAASMALAELENAMGGRLFNRTGRTLVINDRGRRLLGKADVMLDEAEAALEIGADAEAAPAGRIVVGASTTIAGYVLPPRLAAFMATFPEVSAELRVANTDGVHRFVRNGDVDLGIVEGEPDSRGLERREWTGDEIVAVARPDDPLAALSRVTPGALGKRRWLVREEGSGTLDAVAEELRRHDIRPADTLAFGNTESIRSGVECGAGLAWLPLPAVERALERGSLVRLKTAVRIRRRYAILLPPSRRHGRLVREMLAFLEASAG